MSFSSVSDAAKLDLFQQLALVALLDDNDSSKQVLEKVAALRLVASVFEHVSGAGDVQSAKAEAIVNIAQFVKSHPRATEADLVRVVSDQVRIFKERISAKQPLF
ncbi:unnamed protein product [Notodromas monacha]|uniref:Uncharacterized protein n=1 Tax=Notodromas monacha TaxID=399045 RepID=A0A7R9C1L1_9CRUS|nr:unnamed protein product [Notodromas monacha]CAG0925715.1 unnamed protein product [Notodromas monacha]